MSDGAKLVEAHAEFDRCDFCGVELVTKLTIEQEEFDPRSRTSGFGVLDLWPSHPHDGKSICQRCIDRGAHSPEGFVRKPEGCIAARLYEVRECCNCDGGGCAECWGHGKVYGDEGQGLRLPESPITNWDTSPHCGLVSLRERAEYLYVQKVDGFWIPSEAVPWRSMVLSDLMRGDPYIVLCEHTDTTPFRTVLELTYAGQLDRGDLPPTLPSWVAERGGKTFAKLNSRVPMEILQ